MLDMMDRWLFSCQTYTGKVLTMFNPKKPPPGLWLKTKPQPVYFHPGDQELTRRHTFTMRLLVGAIPDTPPGQSPWCAAAKTGRNAVGTSELVRGHGLMEKQAIQFPLCYPVLCSSSWHVLTPAHLQGVGICIISMSSLSPVNRCQ